MASTAARTLTKIKKSEKGAKIFYWSMLILPLVQFFIFYVVVNFNSILMAFQKFNPRTFESVLSIENFTYWFGKPWPTLKVCIANSFKYFLYTLLTIPVSLFISYYIYKKYFLSEFFKVIMFIPSIICISAFVIIYKCFVNHGMKPILGESPIATVYMKYREAALVIFYLLMCFASNILLYINAMGQIKPSLIEAAKMDGAGEFRIFIHVVIPQIWGTIVSLFIIFVAGIATNQAYLFNFFGKDASTELQTIGYFLFKEVQKDINVEESYHLCSALGLMLTAILTPLTIGIRKLMTKFGPSEE